jgi:hypothetical protein
MNLQQIQRSGEFSRPWAIVRLLPKAQRYIVARFANRQDAHDHLRVLQRFIPAAEFEIVFDVPDTRERGTGRTTQADVHRVNPARDTYQ